MKIARLFEFIDHQAAVYPKQDALAGKVDGVWVKYSTEAVIQTSRRFAHGLLALGLKPGDKVAMITANRPEWNMADLGMQQAGVINVPIYTTLSESDIVFILNDCGAKLVLAGDQVLWQKVMSVKDRIASLSGVYCFDRIEGVPSWEVILHEGDTAPDHARLQTIRDGIRPESCATILYTSGTTGTPKGVMLSHHNIVSNVLAVEHLPPVDHRDTALSFLPLCHSYERVLTYLYQYLGVSVYYAESMEKIGDNIREIHPQVFSAVPRLLEKVFDRIVDKGKELTGIKRSLFFWALDLGLKFELDGRNGWWYGAQLALARRLIFSKWREALGGNTRVIVSGGAALQPRLARVFWAAGIPVLEGYGLTETSPIIAVNNFEPRGTCFSTVGPVIKDVEVRIAEDGEILCKGPNVMLGYYNRPDLTAEVIDAEGWFHTGDIGTFVDDRFLKITDRKKEIFKTSGGKYIAPQVLENRLKESPFIEQVMVVGENRKFPGALIVPSFAHLRRWCDASGISCASDAEMVRNESVLARISSEVETINRSFSQFEQIKKFELVGKEWTVDGGELTATLKLRRKILTERNQQLIDRIYEEEGASVSLNR